MPRVYRAPSLCQALWRVPSNGQHPPSRAQSLRKCLVKGKCRRPAHKSMKQAQLMHNQGVQLGGPLPRKEVEYLRWPGGSSGVSRSVSNTPTFEAGHKPLMGCPSIPLPNTGSSSCPDAHCTPPALHLHPHPLAPLPAPSRTT